MKILECFKKNKKKETINKTPFKPDLYASDLDYSKRKERFLLVFTITVGAIIFFVKVIAKLLINAYQGLYEKLDSFILKDSPLGVEHIIFAIILSSLFMILAYIIRYCFLELYCFLDYRNLKSEYLRKADDSYSQLLKICEFHILACTFQFFVLIALFYIERNTFMAYFEIIYIIIISLCILIVIILQIKKKLKLEHGLFHIFMYLLLTIFIILVELKLYSSYPSNLNVDFKDSTTPYMIIHLETINFPDEFSLDISNSKGKQHIKLKADDFLHSMVKVTETNNSNDTIKYRRVLLNKSFDKYLYSIDLSKFIDNGNNSIKLTVSTSNKKVEIQNVLVLNNKTYSFSEKNLNTTY
ncbi:hypothetical protein [Clostridium sp. C8-1-8]|uniref:hypothetical protein n=1 Tax=Clostridium sp. C8-1-8 TaxID=2698831 RepID=UPI0013683430|nr:hypothetical protein [Clostridium sp. C8-1-8]